MLSYSLASFIENMYWIDIIIVFALVITWYFLIHIKTEKICEKNKKYNAELYDMRREIYTEYEKNFFL